MAELLVTSGLLSLSDGIPFGASLPYLLLSSSRPEFNDVTDLEGPAQLLSRASSFLFLS